MEESDYSDEEEVKVRPKTSQNDNIVRDVYLDEEPIVVEINGQQITGKSVILIFH